MVGLQRLPNPFFTQMGHFKGVVQHCLKFNTSWTMHIIKDLVRPCTVQFIQRTEIEAIIAFKGRNLHLICQTFQQDINLLFNRLNIWPTQTTKAAAFQLCFCLTTDILMWVFTWTTMHICGCPVYVEVLLLIDMGLKKTERANIICFIYFVPEISICSIYHCVITRNTQWSTWCVMECFLREHMVKWISSLSIFLKGISSKLNWEYGKMEHVRFQFTCM